MTEPYSLLVVYGTRPEAIKVAPLIVAAQRDDRFRVITVSTGQHREMVDQVNTMFGITPDYELDIMSEGQTLNEIVSRVLVKVDPLLEELRPDALIAQGDTSTALAAALAAFNREIPVVHLEAGLRTGDLRSPFPEEGNRKLIGQITSLHLAPTPESAANLRAETIADADIVVTGNTVIDALLTVRELAAPFDDPALAAVAASDRRVVLVTTHRRENLDAMTQIGAALRDLAGAFPDTTFVLPAHLNPKVRTAVLPAIEHLDNVVVTEPLPYSQFCALMDRSALVLTDSGGVQEEAPSLGKPVLVMRDTTERPEAVAAGTVRLVGTDQADITRGVTNLLTDDELYSTMSQAMNPYGDGQASARCLAALAAFFGVGERLPDFEPGAPSHP